MSGAAISVTTNVCAFVHDEHVSIIVKITVINFLMRIVNIILFTCPSSPIGTSKLLNAKSVRTVPCLSSYRASRIAYGVDKQQPLTPCEYIVLPFGIVYIRSVSVVATLPTPYPILREFDKTDEFNNALRSLCLTTLRKSVAKIGKNRLNSKLKWKILSL